MKNQLTYQFSSQQIADRFLHKVQRSDYAFEQVKRLNGGLCIAVSYTLAADSIFDNTCQVLDDLAAEFGGREVTLGAS